MGHHQRPSSGKFAKNPASRISGLPSSGLPSVLASDASPAASGSGVGRSKLQIIKDVLFTFSDPTPEDTEGFEDPVFLETDPSAPIIDVSTDTSDEVLGVSDPGIDCDMSLPGSSLVVVGDDIESRGAEDPSSVSNDSTGPPLATVSEVHTAATLLQSLKEERRAEFSKSLDWEEAGVHSSTLAHAVGQPPSGIVPLITLDDTQGSTGGTPDVSAADSSVMIVSPNSSGQS